MTTRHAHSQREPKAGGVTYRGTFALIAALTVLFTAFSITLVEHPSLAPLRTLLSTGSLPGDATPLVPWLRIIGVSLLAGITAYLAAAQIVAFMRLAFYDIRLHRYVRNRLRLYAPLAEQGLTLRAQSLTVANSEPHDAAILVEDSPKTFLIGDAGSGKTSFLHQIACKHTGLAALIRQFFRRKPLPVLIPLAAAELYWTPDQPNLLPVIQIFARRFGSQGFAARIPSLARQGRLELLFDGLDDLAPLVRALLLDQIFLFARETASRIVVTTRMMDIRNADIVTVVRQHPGFACLLMQPLEQQEIVRALQRVPVPRGIRRPRGEHIVTALQSLLLRDFASHPAALAALARAWSQDAPLPAGRAGVLRAATDALLQNMQSALGVVRTREVLSLLAASLWSAEQKYIILAPSASIGKTLSEWVRANQPLAATQTVSSHPFMLNPVDAQIAGEEALDAGILIRSADGRVLRFADPHTLTMLVAFWLDITDAGAALDVGLLEPHWLLPVVLWSGAVAAPNSVSPRLASLAHRSTHAESSLAHLGEDESMALVLAVATASECFAATLATAEEQGQGSDVWLMVEQNLRDLLDTMQHAMETPAGQDHLSDAFRAVVQHAGENVTRHIGYLAGHHALGRFVRAQLLLMLGLLASPLALNSVVAHLRDSDPLIRQATHQAITLAGERAIEPLRAALSDPDDVMRARAGEAMGLLGEAAIEAALAGLSGHHASQRAASARTLGVLRATAAIGALGQALHDPDNSVQSAAALALGRVGGKEVIPLLSEATRLPGPQARAAAVHALGLVHDLDTYETVLALLDDNAGIVRAAAAQALGTLGDPRAVNPLRARLTDPEPGVQNAVARALRRIHQTRSVV